MAIEACRTELVCRLIYKKRDYIHEVGRKTLTVIRNCHSIATYLVLPLSRYLIERQWKLVVSHKVVSS